MPCRSVLILATLLCVLWVVSMTMSDLAHADVNDLEAERWSGGAGIGFLGNTPDGVAEFGVNGHVDYFLSHNISVGPLAQYAGAGNDFLIGLSAQARYWWDVPGAHNLAKIVFQCGIGFVRAGIKDTDSGVANTYVSFLIPIGIGLDYAVTKQLAVTADFLLNLTALGETVRARGRDVDLHTNIMPGFYLGVRF